MTRSVNFNGITQFRPGGLSKVDANALAQIGLDPNGIIGLIGEAEEGEPDVVNQIDDPALAVPTFGSGPLADAIRVAFDPSGDPRVPAGAFRVLAVKTNQGTQSTLTLNAIIPPVTGGPPCDTVASVNAAKTVITLTTAGLVVNAHIGNTLRIGTEERTITANAASTVTVSVAYTGVYPATTPVYFLTPVLTYTSLGYGLPANRVKQEVEVGASQGVVWTGSRDTYSEISDDVGGRSYLDLEYIGQGIQTIVDSGVSSSESTTIITDSTKAWSSSAMVGYFAYCTASWLTTANLRLISANNSTSFTMPSALNGVASGHVTYAIRRGAIHTGTIVSATARTVTLEATTHIAVNELANLVLAITGGTGAGQRRVIASNIAGVSSVLTLTNAWDTNPDGTSTYAVRSVSSAKATMTSSSPGITNGLTVAVAKDGAAATTDLTIAFATGQTIQDLVNRINTNSDYAAYVPSGVNNLALINDFDYDSGAYAVSIREDRSAHDAAPFPGFVYTAAASGTGDSLTMANGIVTLDDTAGQFTAAMVGQLINVVGTSAPGDIGWFPIVGVASATKLFFENAAGVTETSAFTYSILSPISMKWPNHFRKDLAALVADITAKSQLATVTRSAATGLGAGSGLPEYTGSGVGSRAVVGDYYKFMAGAIRGTSTNTDWQNAFDTLLRVRKVSVVPCISEDLAGQGYGSAATFASVASQAAAHVALCRGVEKNECGAYLGMIGTRAQYIAQLNAMNDMDVSVTNQYFTFMNAAGVLTVMDPWASAVAAAGMRAGMPEVGEPLTHKYINTTTVTQSTSWDPADRTDANTLIQNGALFAEYIEGKGIRWVRDLTSYIIDDNLAYAEGSVRDVCRYYSYGLRTFLEDRFTGVKAHPANAANIKESVAEYSELCRGQNIIVDSVNATTGEVVCAYHKIRITISGDIARIRVEIFPVVGINFQLTEIYLQLPTQSA